MNIRADELYTVTQVAAYLQVCQGSVYRYIKSGRLVACRVGGGIRIARSDLIALLRSPATEAPRRRTSVGAAIFPEEAANVVDLSVWEKSDARMRRLKGIPSPEPDCLVAR